MISSGLQVHREEPLEEVAGLHCAPAALALDVDLGVERHQDGGVVGRRIGVRQAAADGAAVAHLRVADRRGRFRERRTLVGQERRRRHRVVRRGGADLDLAVLLRDARQPRDAGDVDERGRLAEPQLHQRNQAVAAGQQLGGAIGRAQSGDRVVERRRARVVERSGNHAWPPWMMRHSFSGRSIMSMCFTPNSLSASTAADTMAGVEPSVPASPQPFGAERVDRRRRDGVAELEAREVDRPRHRVVHERAGEELAVLAVDDLFDHRLADALGEAAVNLPSTISGLIRLPASSTATRRSSFGSPCRDRSRAARCGSRTDRCCCSARRTPRR
jgi:hypothetical protein